MHVNVRAPFRLMRAAVPHLKQRKGSVVNVSSVNGLRAFAGVLAYNVSKAAMDHLTRCAALEMAPFGVRVNCVNPGVTITNLHRRGGMDDAQNAAFLQRSKETHPLGRPGQPEEVAAMIVFLASERGGMDDGRDDSDRWGQALDLSQVKRTNAVRSRARFHSLDESQALALAEQPHEAEAPGFERRLLRRRRAVGPRPSMAASPDAGRALMTRTRPPGFSDPDALLGPSRACDGAPRTRSVPRRRRSTTRSKSRVVDRQRGRRGDFDFDEHARRSAPLAHRAAAAHRARRRRRGLTARPLPRRRRARPPSRAADLQHAVAHFHARHADDQHVRVALPREGEHQPLMI